MSIEQLINLDVTSVSKKETRLLDSPAAVAVLTQDDLRRLGATSIPEALRAIPGLQVARMNANVWAVSSRGFNDQYSNKLLVLVDGRSVYTPTFGGVYWNSQDLVLEDLDRIEVIRGPGATLWGANAVDGVINIITKSARETQGLLVSTSYGTEDQPSLSARYGGKLADNLYYRVYAKYFNREGFEDRQGNSMADGWDAARSGLRLDWEPTDKDTLTLLGDYYHGSYGEQVTKNSVFPSQQLNLGIQAPDSGGDVLARWTHKFSDESEMKLQVYYDRYQREHPFGGGVIVAAPDEFKDRQNRMGERRDTWDVDAQHRFALGSRQDVVWGFGYRYTEDKLSSREAEIFWNPAQRQDQLLSAFLQDEITLVKDRLHLTLGSKFEHNDFTGCEVQPSGRFLWTPTEHQSVWASVARAIRMPTRLELDSRINIASFSLPDGTPALSSVFPNPTADAETVLAYELGYRIEPTRRLSFDLAAFYNQYDLLVPQPTASRLELNPPPPHLLYSPFTYQNDVSGHTFGTELFAQWAVTERWRLSAGSSWLRTSFAARPAASRTNPQHQFNVRSSLDLTHGWELNAATYYVGRIESQPFGPAPATIPAYLRLDVGLTWRANEHLELSIWGQNLLDPGHQEIASYKAANIAEVPRTVYGKITWRF